LYIFGKTVILNKRIRAYFIGEYSDHAF
jgi:hypothetical protein